MRAIDLITEARDLVRDGHLSEHGRGLVRQQCSCSQCSWARRAKPLLARLNAYIKATDAGADWIEFDDGGNRHGSREWEAWKENCP